ncbi:MAG: type IV pilus assembly protein PilV [Candidatus Endobugula sp.]|jgi:type IV pilus assembly protein PilV
MIMVHDQAPEEANIKPVRFVKKLTSQRGASFIEVLVALIILVIGLLGLLSMQANGLNSSQRAIFAAEANFLASDMTDRILSYGIAGADQGEFRGMSTRNAFAVQPGGVTALEMQVLVQHAADWTNIIGNASLPSADAEVNWNALTNVYTVTIRWDEERTGSAGRVCNRNRDAATNNLDNLTCLNFQVTP